MILKSTLLLLFSIAILKAPNHTNSLVNTIWTSSFYHYANYYAFLTNNKGFKLQGQVDWSCPIDTLTLGISGDKYLYGDTLFFTYTLKDSSLTIHYLSESEIDTFFLESSKNRWTGIREYVYGNEVLVKVPQLEYLKY